MVTLGCMSASLVATMIKSLRHPVSQAACLTGTWIGLSLLTLCFTHGAQWDSFVYNMPWHLLVNAIPLFL